MNATAEREARPVLSTNALWLVAVSFALVLGGCAQDSVDITALTPDQAVFREQVYPIILRDCGFPQCHGSSQRFYQVFGPGRVRIGAPPEGYEPNDVRFVCDPMTHAGCDTQMTEVLVTYERTRSMLTRTSTQEDFLLLRKALEVGAGGAGHKGTDRLGRNVYQSREDPSWKTLQAWALASMTGSP